MAQVPEESFRSHWGERYEAIESDSRSAGESENASLRSALSSIQRWNRIAIDASGLDHTPVRPGEPRVFGEQLGPCRAARAMAIVHIAIFEALNASTKRCQSFVGLHPAPSKTDRNASIAQAAHDTLKVLFPSQAPRFSVLLAEDLDAIPDRASKRFAINLGRTAALATLGQSYNDGSAHAEPRLGTGFLPSNDPGFWRQDPISQLPVAMGAEWALRVRPLVMPSASFFRLPPPPAMTSAEYTAAFDEVKQLGGDGITTPTTRTEEQTLIGIYWAYDGTPSLCAPPRLYNQIAVQIAEQMGSNDLETARLLALVNIAMSDAGIAAWDSKYHYQVWRPVGGIRESDPGTGPTGLGDGNANTVGDPSYSPLGAPASNLQGPNFTPPFPAYPSGHAVFGAALFQMLRNFYGRDDVSFTFVSDELNGITRDNQGQVRPLVPRSFSSFSQAEEENGQSRIYLGIHWSFDKTGGIAQGRQVADYIYARVYRPVGATVPQ